ELDAPGIQIKRLIYFGDTKLLDGTAFENICLAGNWPGIAFIGSENDLPQSIEIVPLVGEQTLYLSNRWAALSEFDQYCSSVGFAVDEFTAVLIDIDKTALGARGRNAYVIDQVRMQAVEDTVADLLGSDFDEETFKEAYVQWNQVDFHPFTTDNQDYLAYICLILGSGLYDFKNILGRVRDGELTSFLEFISEVDSRKTGLSPVLAEIHGKIYTNVQSGDPTPFKAFRRSEYLTTIRRMGFLDDNLPVSRMLAEEILITHEVRELAMVWRSRGSLVFSLSDKPDEASVPTPELAASGYQPIHRTETHVVGDGQKQE
ncbi:MAG: hypothetical protein WBF05_12125, partial [Anaerolineales bacterium]